MRHDYEYYSRILEREALPYAFVDLDLLKQNVALVVSKAGDKRIRPGTKAVRSVAVLRAILDSDSRLSGSMCYSAAEAVFLSERGFDDLLVAYPTCQTAQLEKVCSELRRGKSIVLTFDSEDHLSRYQAVAERQDVILPLCLDLDLATRFPFLHFGIRWSTVNTPEQARRLCRVLKSSANLRLSGVIAYEAQIAGLPDRLPGHRVHNSAARILKSLSLPKISKLRREVVQAVENEGGRLDFVNAGGTASLEITAQDETVTELTPGSGFYAPALFDYYRNSKFLPAAAYAVEITRKAGKSLVCHGGGYNAPGVCDPSKAPVPYLPEGIRLTAMEGAGEVQTPMTYEGNERMALGDPVFFRTSTAGILAEHFNQLILISDGKIVDRVTTYRGDGMCFV